MSNNSVQLHEREVLASLTNPEIFQTICFAEIAKLGSSASRKSWETVSNQAINRRFALGSDHLNAINTSEIYLLVGITYFANTKSFSSFRIATAAVNQSLVEPAPKLMKQPNN
jgi:hypothetical protein